MTKARRWRDVSQECRQPTESGRGKEQSIPEVSRLNQSADFLTLAQGTNFRLLNCKTKKIMLF